MGGGREGKYTVEGTGVTFRGEEFGNLNMQQTVSIAGQTVHSDAKAKEIFDKNIGRETPAQQRKRLLGGCSGGQFVCQHRLPSQKPRTASATEAGCQYSRNALNSLNSLENLNK